MADNTLSFSKKVLIAVSLSALIILILLFLGFVINIVLLVFAGILLAVLLKALSRLIQKLISVSDNISLLIVVAALFLIMSGVSLIIGPSLVDGMENLSKQIPSSLEKLESEIKQFSWGEPLVENIKRSTKDFIEDPQATSRITGIFSSAVSGIFGIVVVLIIGLYGAYNPKVYTAGFLKLLPKRKQKRAMEIIDTLDNALIWWMAGQFTSMSIIGILTTIGLLILGIPLAFPLGVIAAVLTFIPNIGPVISALPAVLLGLMESPTTALYVIILYVTTQTIESYIITPMIQKKAVYLPPAILISVQILIGVLLGAFGLLLATPIMVVVIVLVQTIYVQDILGHDVTILGERNPKL